MATITAAAGSTNWTTAAFGAQAATTAADDVIIPTGASVTITASNTVLCRSLSVTGTGTIIFAATTSSVSIGTSTPGSSNVALSIASTATVTLTGIGSINFVSTSSTQQTITSGGKTLPVVIINGAGSSYIQADALNMSGNFTLSTGTYNTGNFSLTTTKFASIGSSARTFTAGSSTITITTNNNVWWDTSTTTNLTFNYNTSTIVAPPSTTSATANWGGITLYNLSYTGGASKTATFYFSSNVTIQNTLTITGNSSINRVFVANLNAATLQRVTGTPITITVNGSVALTHVDFMDIVAAGTAGTWSSASSLGDCGGNSNITFPGGQTNYFVGSTSGSWSDSTRWANTSNGTGGTGRVPLPQDDAVLNQFSANSTSRTVSIDMPRLGKNLTTSQATQGQTLTGTLSSEIYGSWNNVDNTWGNTLTSATLTFAGRGGHTITMGQSLGNTSVLVDAPGATLTLGAALAQSITTGSFILRRGTFNTSNYNVSFGTYTIGGGFATTLNAGTSTFASLTVAAATVLTTNATGLTMSADSATLTMATSANAKTINIASGLTWGTIDYSNSGSTGGLTLSGTGRIRVLKFSDATNARTLTISAASAQIDDWSNVFGTSGKNMSIVSSAAGTARSISVQGTTVSTVNYCTFQDIKILEPYKLYATNSTSTSNNTNITFSAAPSAPLLRQQTSLTTVSSNTTGTVTYPSATAAGNLLVCMMGAASTLGTITPPTGWTQADVKVNTTNVVMFYKVATGSETTVTPTWSTSASPQIYAYEIYNWSGQTPTLDTVAESTSTTSTSLATGSATNSTSPGISIVAFSGSGSLGASSTAPTNSFQEDYNSQQATGSVLKFGLLPVTSSAARSTTFTWTTSRIPVSVLVNFVGTTSSTNSNFFQFF